MRLVVEGVDQGFRYLQWSCGTLHLLSDSLKTLYTTPLCKLEQVVCFGIAEPYTVVVFRGLYGWGTL